MGHQHSNNATNRLWSLFLSVRPWSFLLGLNTMFLGACLAYRATGSLNVPVFLLTVACTICVEAATNLVNTYVDYVKGIDDHQSTDRTLVDGILMPNTVADFIAVLYFLACVLFGFLAYASPAPLYQLLPIFVVGVCVSVFYTAVIGLKYIALGDLFVMMMFGPAIVLMTYAAQGGQSFVTTALYSIPLAIFTEAALHSNNTRDFDQDKSKGILTLAILLGKAASGHLFTGLVFAPYLICILLAAYLSLWFLLPLVTVFSAFGIERRFNGGQRHDGPAWVAQLSAKFAVLYVGACFLADQSTFSNLS